MPLSPFGQPKAFEVTYDTGLSHVAVSIYDVTSGSASLVTTIAMGELPDLETYFAIWNDGEIGKSYVAKKAVYTDSGFTIRDDNYAPGSESFEIAQVSNGAPTIELRSQGLIALLPQQPTLSAFLSENEGLVGVSP